MKSVHPIQVCALLAMLVIVLLAAATAEAGCGGALQLNAGHCQVQQFRQQVVQPYAVQQIVVPQVQHYVAPQQIIVQRQVVGHARQNIVVQRLQQPRQITRQRIVTRSR